MKRSRRPAGSRSISSTISLRQAIASRSAACGARRLSAPANNSVSDPRRPAVRSRELMSATMISATPTRGGGEESTPASSLSSVDCSRSRPFM